MHRTTTGSDVPPDHAATAHPRRHGGADGPPTCEHGRWQFAGVRLQAQGVRVALPHQRVQARVPVDQSKPPPHLIPRDSDRWRKLYRGRAAVDASSAGWKHEWSPLTHPRARYRAGPATRRPDDPRQARLRPRQGASRTARGVAVRSTTYAWSAVLHPTLHSPLQGSASARPVDQPVSKECSRTNAELPMSTPSFANPS